MRVNHETVPVGSPAVCRCWFDVAASPQSKSLIWKRRGTSKFQISSLGGYDLLIHTLVPRPLSRVTAASCPDAPILSYTFTLLLTGERGGSLKIRRKVIFAVGRSCRVAARPGGRSPAVPAACRKRACRWRAAKMLLQA